MKMNDVKKFIGVIVEVNNDCSKIGVYSLLNDSTIIWNGQLLSGPKVGAYLTINQNEVNIIAKVISEKVIDQQNNINSSEFDNRFHKDTMNRVIEVKTIGVIEDGSFQVTSRYVPMVGNQVSITTEEELKCMLGLSKSDDVIKVGHTLLEGFPVEIPINKFFASHIGIFGNTGSGKSNTLHKLYLELFKLRDQYPHLLEKSRFFIIDFNGEYTDEHSFGLGSENKRIFKINTRSEEKSDKLFISRHYIFNADILAILFEAKPGTQLPFLQDAIEKFNEIENSDDQAENFSKIEKGLLIKILESFKANNNTKILELWRKAAKEAKCGEETLNSLNYLVSHVEYGNATLRAEDGNYIVKDGQITDYGKQYIDPIRQSLEDAYRESIPLERLKIFLEFQEVFKVFYGSIKYDYINPMISRMRTAIKSLEKVIEIDENSDNHFETVNVISLLHANLQMKRLIPMLLSKMIYDEHKRNSANRTVHLIIDEAHNILNSQAKNVADDYQDYRLSVFEEIIKEGRKFGFFLTLASQRPADISPTIMSQLHNYIIHRLVNDKDLQMLENTMPTLDYHSYKTIPLLGQGEAVITGIAFSIPVIAKIDKEEINRPKSDDVVLTDIWAK